MTENKAPVKTARGRGRPRKAGKPVGKARPVRVADKGAPREEILKVAASLFSLKGYAGTTMAEIADAVGIRSPSMYYHFSDKAEILRALANICLDEALSDTQKLLNNRSEPIPKRLYSLVHEQVYRLCDSPYELNCMFDPAFHTPEFAVVDKRLKAWLGNLEALIRQGIDDGFFSQQNTKVATYTVRGLVESAIRQMGGFSKMSSMDTADYVATFAIKGLLIDPKHLKGISDQ